MNPPFHSDAWPWVGVVVTGGLAFVLACRLSAAPTARPGGGSGVADLLFGESRHALSASLFDRADTYFHKGVAHRAASALTNDWIQGLLANIAPEAHRHAEGEDSVEILPWLRLSTRADPHNVDAYLVTAFWVETGLHRPALAEDVLTEAERENPGDYRVLLEKGCLFLRAGRWPQAAAALEAAATLWPSTLDPKDRQTLLDKSQIYADLGFLREMEGRRPEAIAFFKNILAVFPERTYISERISLLESNRPPDVSARQLLEKLSRRTPEQVYHEEDDDHGHRH